jgi:hypothetical protein
MYMETWAQCRLFYYMMYSSTYEINILMHLISILIRRYDCHRNTLHCGNSVFWDMKPCIS